VVYLDRLKRQRPQVQGIVTRGNHGQSLAFNWQFRGNFERQEWRYSNCARNDLKPLMLH
jgi:hypothetical protein